MKVVMDLAKRFEEATNVTSLEPHKLYPINRAPKYGPTVVLNLRVSETSIVQVFLP